MIIGVASAQLDYPTITVSMDIPVNTTFEKSLVQECGIGISGVSNINDDLDEEDMSREVLNLRIRGVNIYEISSMNSSMEVVKDE